MIFIIMFFINTANFYDKNLNVNKLGYYERYGLVTGPLRVRVAYFKGDSHSMQNPTALSDRLFGMFTSRNIYN